MVKVVFQNGDKSNAECETGRSISRFQCIIMANVIVRIYLFLVLISCPHFHE